MMRTAKLLLTGESPVVPWAGAVPCGGGVGGFSLIELMIVVAIIGILAAIALPSYQILTVRARVAEGLSLMGGVRPAIADFYEANGELPTGLTALGLNGDSTPPPVFAGTVTEAAAFSAAYGFSSDLWKGVEWQVKTAGCATTDRCAAMVLRSTGSTLTGGVDIGLHLQVLASSNGVRFRCVVNDYVERLPYVPANCRKGSANDYSTW